MKRLSNIIYYLALIPAIAYGLFLWFSGDAYKWTALFFTITFFLSLIAYVINAVDRYSSLLIFLRPQNQHFHFVSPLGKDALRWSNMTFIMGIIFAYVFGPFLFIAYPDTEKIGVLLCISGLEKLVFWFVSRSMKLFALGLNKNALIINNGGFILIPFGGLKSIESKYDELLFHYGEHEVKSTYRFLPVKENTESFFNALESLCAERNIPVSINRSK